MHTKRAVTTWTMQTRPDVQRVGFAAILFVMSKAHIKDFKVNCTVGITLSLHSCSELVHHLAAGMHIASWRGKPQRSQQGEQCSWELGICIKVNKAQVCQYYELCM
ncbi:unnamed protein product [Durusdinium trenchii]|uniref:Uncharacterized protein n=1 Tax=Durusdinium trenchii TaxID=1381693 RepID=A0ABP0NS05_9DINO